MRILLAISLILCGSVGAQAGIFDDIRDALRGHTIDVIERITHEDQMQSGMYIISTQFRQDDVGRDAIHWANGTISLVLGDDDNFYLQLHEDFEAGPAPDLYLYIAEDKVVDEDSFHATTVFEVGKLVSSKGASFYEVNEVPNNMPHVVIWCKRFGAFIAAAEFKAGQ